MSPLFLPMAGWVSLVDDQRRWLYTATEPVVRQLFGPLPAPLCTAGCILSAWFAASSSDAFPWLLLLPALAYGIRYQSARPTWPSSTEEREAVAIQLAVLIRGAVIITTVSFTMFRWSLSQSWLLQLVAAGALLTKLALLYPAIALAPTIGRALGGFVSVAVLLWTLFFGIELGISLTEGLWDPLVDLMLSTIGLTRPPWTQVAADSVLWSSFYFGLLGVAWLATPLGIESALDGEDTPIAGLISTLVRHRLH